MQKNSLTFFIIVFLLIFTKGFAQSDTTYVDENNQFISKTIFYKNAKSGLYRGKRFSTDIEVLEKLRFRYYFGKLEPSVKTQLFKLLYRDIILILPKQ